MNRRQKEVDEASLDDEEEVIKKLKQAYRQASKDCEDAIAELNTRMDMQNLQSIVYQKQYQEALKKQIDSVLDKLQTDEFSSVADYLTSCYETGYIGTMYDLQGQGIPITVPIDQSKVVKAVETDSQISTTMYTRLGEDVSKLKRDISAEMSRGTVVGKSWLEIASDIAVGMNSPFTKALNKTIRIARTEGHRIQQASRLDACEEAKAKGADVVKQWDATLDSRTRPDHAAADGQIRELDEYFNVGGEKMKAPGIGGSARNVCNCRCQLTQRAKWMLDKDELDRLRGRAEFFGLDKTADFEEYKQKYLQATNSDDTMESVRFYSASDPMAEVTGPGEISNPKEIAEFKQELEDMGVELRERNVESYAYSPGVRAGKPGQVIISKEASYSAWCHEMQHARDDRDDGWLGIGIITDPKKCYEREVRAYAVEIELARKAGREDVVEKLEKNLEAEREYYHAKK